MSDAVEADGKCPKCGGELYYGFGLAGSGYGPYECCLNDACDYFRKEQLREDDSREC